LTFILALAGVGLLRPGIAQTASEPLTIPTIAEFLKRAPSLNTNDWIKIDGAVTLHYRSGAIFIQDATEGLYAESLTNGPVRVGEMVEVVGRVYKRGFSPTLHEVKYRSLGQHTNVPSKAVTGAELRSGRYDMRLVKIRGRLVGEPNYINDGQGLVLLFDGFPINLHLGDVVPQGPLSQLRPGSLLQAVGVCSVDAAPGGRAGAARLQLRSPNDIVVLSPPDWWTEERAIYALCAAAALAVASLLWVGTLRRQVRVRTAEVQQLNRALENRVTERTARLREMVAELEQYSYSISHDMRGPLRAMNQFSTILLEEHAGSLNPDAQDLLRRISSAAHRMDELIEDVLNYSRIAREELPLTRIELNRLIDDVLTQYPALHAAEVDVRRPLLPALGNEAALTQCLSNLLGNAVKFVAPGVVPRVQLWTEAHGDRVRVWVADNGIGISPEHLNRIWEIFSRLHASDSYEGTGIGLSIVKKAVERMSGTVGVESSPGAGSRFWFELRGA
jgi:signal transduction histidine kinase